MRIVRAVVGFVAGVVVAATALAGSAEVKVAGVGGAQVQWNGVRYSKRLVDQISPGLVWRMGSNSATRMTVEGMALVCDGGIVFPGEASLVLRFLSAEKGDLIAFEENTYQWSEDKHNFALLPVEIWKEKDAKKVTEGLELKLRTVTAKARAQKPAAETATTGGTAAPKAEMPSPVTYSKEAQAEHDKTPWVEFEMRFGELAGLAAFEAAEVGELKGKHGEAKTPFVMRWPKYKAPRAKSELVATGTDVVFGVLREDPKDAAKPQEWLVVVSGGEKPEMELREIGRAATPRRIEGERVETKAAPKSVDWTFEEKVLVLHIHGADYRFPW